MSARADGTSEGRPSRSPDGKVRLPLVARGDSSIRADGRRALPIPADVRGRFTTARRALWVALVAFWLALPVVRVGGGPAVFLDVEHRRFYLFGATFNAQDVWLLFFLLTGVAFGLVYLTTLAGRVFCGWFCPQTVFMEAVFRPIERLFEGSREARLRRESHARTFGGVLRKVGKHLAFVLAAAAVSHVFLGYFVSLRVLWGMLQASPREHPEAFAWALGTTGVLYVHFAFFREQFCVVMCPYGRLQSVLLQEDSLVVGYDEKRGEPRGKASDPGAGACVDCKRCVVVCPTGIDIRSGLQLDCVACTACIDACDEVMDKLGRPRGLVRYDSLVGLAGGKTRWIRPRVVLYTGLLLLGVVVAATFARRRGGFEANLLRLHGSPYERETDPDTGAERVRNGFELHVVNKGSETATYRISVSSTDPTVKVVTPASELSLDSLADRRVPLFVSYEPRGGPRPAFTAVVEQVGKPDQKPLERPGTLLGPSAPSAKGAP
jgi:cytochrome c oxidase accessory protein FixG